MPNPTNRQKVHTRLGRELNDQEIQFLLSASKERKLVVKPIDRRTTSDETIRRLAVEASGLLLQIWAGNLEPFHLTTLMDGQYAEARRSLEIKKFLPRKRHAPSAPSSSPTPQAPSAVESWAYQFEIDLGQDDPEPKSSRTLDVDDIADEVESNRRQLVIDVGSEDEDEDFDFQPQQGFQPPLAGMGNGTNMSFEAVVALWAVTEGVQRKKVVSLFRMLRQFQPQLNCNSLPASWATVMRRMGATGAGEDTMGTPVHLHVAADQSNIPPPLRSIPPCVTVVNVGNYYYFGLLKTLLGESIGSLHYFENLACFRHFYIVRPDFFNEDLLEATKLRQGMADDWEEIRKKLRFLDERHAKHRTKVDLITLLVDINVDGVRVCSLSSNHSLLTPVLVRLVGVKTNLGTFRFRHTKYGVCAYILGHEKPPYSVLLRDLASELKERAPSVKDLQLPKPTLRLKLWRGICDAPARADCLNCFSFSSYGGACRCKQPGIKQRIQGRVEGSTKPTGVLFLNLNCENIPRLASEWDDYRHDREGLPAHVKEQRGPLEDVPDFDPVYDFVLDPMHLIDGGVLLALALNLTNLGPKGVFHDSGVLDSINAVISWYNRFVPLDFQREFSTLDEIKNWKMRVTRNFFMYPALVIITEFRSRMRPGNADLWTEQIHNIVGAIRRCAGFSAKPVAAHVLKEVSQLIKEYLAAMQAHLGDSIMAFKHHHAVHVPDDLILKGGHLDDISAYGGEGFQPIWQDLLHKGPVPDVQLRNRMLEIYSFKLPKDDQGNIQKTSVTEDKISHLLKHHAPDDLWDELPANTPVQIRTGVESNRRGKALVFEGFQLRHTFPNNVCKRKDGRCFFITNMDETCPGMFTVTGHEFLETREAFPDKPTAGYGYSVAPNGLQLASETFLADEIHAKCFALPIQALHKVGKEHLAPFVPNQLGKVPKDGWSKWMLIDMIH